MPEFIEVVKNYDATKRKWLPAELELKRHMELMVKSDIAQAALEVKLKKCRNQVNVEIKKRYKPEADFQHLVWIPLTLLGCPIGAHDLDFEVNNSLSLGHYHGTCPIVISTIISNFPTCFS